jgi:signal peptidase I
LLFDFCPYNAITGERLEANVDEGAFWTGDLTLNATIEIQEVLDQPAVTFEVCEGIYWYRCRINPQTGQAALIEVNQAQDPNLEKPLAEAQTVVTGPGTYHVSFANVDNRLCVWINDQLIDFGDKALLQRDGGTTLSLPQLSDLSPVGIAAQGVSATVKNLLLQRDVYYRSGTHAGNMLQVGLESRIGDFEKWREHYAANAASDQQEIKVDDDGFLAFGDNSPRSRDSRLWQTGMQSVPRRNLVGRAFFIYWPHGVPVLNDGRGYSVWDHRVPATDEHGRRIIEKVEDYPKWTVPFYPQFNRMRRIR